MKDINFAVPSSVPDNNLGQSESNSVFKIKPVSEIVTDLCNLIPIKKVFNDFAFENEITFIGGTTNVGKSILAMDIAMCIATGEHHWNGSFINEVQGKVVLIDTEQSDHQFARRYPGLSKVDNLYRAAFWPDKYGCVDEIEVLRAIEDLFYQDVKPVCIILDNLSTVLTMTSAQKTQFFMQELKKVKEAYGCSLIVVTHTNKTHSYKPIEMDDFRGTKMLMNIADQVIALGNTSEDKETKYIKILKSRSGRIPETVSLVSIAEDGGGLHFEYDQEVDELDVLPKRRRRGPSSTITPEIGAKILHLHDTEKLSIRDIAKILDIGKSTVGRYLESQKQ